MRLLKNGQWSLESLKKNTEEGPKPSIHSLMGQTHTVEVHPDIDHLYRAKGYIQESGRPHWHLGDFKKMGDMNHIIKKIPHDVRGRVTPEMIDKHIAGLPKQKVEVQVVPYHGQFQQHRRAVPQYVASVGFHPDTLAAMPEQHREYWQANMKEAQHQLGGHSNQIGWARIDPYRKIDEDDPIPNDNHWHLDEIQSDFGTPEKMKSHVEAYTNPAAAGRNAHLDPKFPTLRAWKEKVDQLWTDYEREVTENHNSTKASLAPKLDRAQKAQSQLDAMQNEAGKSIVDRRKKGESINSFVQTLNHGHEDPQHLIHSAINQLARQHGIKSTSMDMPLDQAEQSGLRESDNNYDDHLSEAQYEWDSDLSEHFMQKPWTPDQFNDFWNQTGKSVAADHIHDMHFKQVANKLGPEGVKELAGLVSKPDGGDSLYSGINNTNKWNDNVAKRPELSQETINKLRNLSADERYSIIRFGDAIHDHARQKHAVMHGFPERPEAIQPEQPLDLSQLPVHFLNTYHKRPRRLGMESGPKNIILGDAADDAYTTVQYGRLYKRLLELNSLLKSKK